ncbi:hypothetical protein NBRC116589_29430 [Ruegeria sp. HU-ET01832]|uniref:hypothetical protein n=1 Tax=Ruegeria sp. HU-ET01832 TaxID=3135906 RepID=UPI003108B053
MELIADIFLVAGALGAGLYCFVLSRRLRRFTDLEKGVGGAVAVLSSQADELKKSLDSARATSDQAGDELKSLTLRAESVAQQLELMMASMHDVIPEKDEVEETVSAGETETAFLPKDEVSTEPESTTELTEKPEPKRAMGLMFMRHTRKIGEGTA